jgi:hypothetical protein
MMAAGAVMATPFHLNKNQMKRSLSIPSEQKSDEIEDDQ